MYAVRRRDFEEALLEEDEFWDLVQEEKESIREVIHEMTLIYTSLNQTFNQDVDKATHIPSWVEVPRRVPQAAVAEDKSLAKINMLNDELDEPYKLSCLFKFARYRFTITEGDGSKL